jgi:hypothetical protein
VLGVCIENACKAYSLSLLEEKNVLNDELNGTPILVAYDPDNGAADVFGRQSANTTLTFSAIKDGTAPFKMIDDESNSTWDMTGLAIDGPMKGTKLEPYPHFSRVLWFSWINFFPETELAT